MKKRQIINLKVILMLVAVVALALAILSSHAQAQVACPGTATDSDGDGFTDAQECAGITLNLGTAAAVTFPVCASGLASNDPARALCVDPNSKDLFVILVRATPSLIPSDPLKFISAPQAAGGLGIATHEISPNQAASDRKLVFGLSARAVKITESLNTDGTGLGESNQGMLLDDATVFTQRIVNLVNSVCAGTTECKDNATSFTGQALIDHFIRNTTAHEGCGHPCDVAADYNARFGGNHYKAGTIVVMEQHVTYKKAGANVTWYISTTYPATDQAAANTLP